MAIKIEQLRQYLLGSLSQNKIEEIDLLVISDETIEDNLIVAEESLIEDYLEGALTDLELKLFNDNFLKTQQRKLQVATVAELKELAKERDIQPVADEEKNETATNFFRGLINGYKLKPIYLSFALLIICVFGFLGWFLFIKDVNNLTTLEQEYVQINKRNYQDLSKFEASTPILLIGGKTRSNDNSNELLKRKLTEDVFFSLALPLNSEKGSSYTIELFKNNKVIFTQVELQTYFNGSGEELRFVLPAQILELGEYDIRSINNSDKTDVNTFSFSVK